MNILRLSRATFPAVFSDFLELRNVAARLQAMKPDMTHITSSRNVISIKQTDSNAFPAFILARFSA